MPVPVYPTHNKTYFYKYTSTNTAQIILKSGKVRYSSPLLFNDPFDVQTELRFDFDISALPQLVQEEIEDIIFSRKEVELNESDEWGKAIALLKEKVKTHGYYAKEIKTFIDLFLNHLTGLIKEARLQFNKNWQDFLPRLRVFSISETNNNLLMWSHYADYHKGVVLKLKVIPELDTPLCVAGPVIYKPTLPVFFKAKQWIEYILGIKEIDHKKLHWDYAYIKSAIWSYEKEWRVWDLLTETSPELYSDYELYPKELETIFFGCKASDKIKSNIMKEATAYNPKINFYQAEKSKNDYGLIFNEI